MFSFHLYILSLYMTGWFGLEYNHKTPPFTSLRSRYSKLHNVNIQFFPILRYTIICHLIIIIIKRFIYTLIPYTTKIQIKIYTLPAELQSGSPLVYKTKSNRCQCPK
eukprot:sb/3477636/